LKTFVDKWSLAGEDRSIVRISVKTKVSLFTSMYTNYKLGSHEVLSLSNEDATSNNFSGHELFFTVLQLDFNFSVWPLLIFSAEGLHLLTLTILTFNY